MSASSKGSQPCKASEGVQAAEPEIVEIPSTSSDSRASGPLNVGETETHSQRQRSIIESLSAPTPSDLARKRKIRSNLTHSGKRRIHPKTTSDPKNVSIGKRKKEFPGENFKESAGKLFCTSCREEVGLKKAIINQHVRSVKHANGKSRLTKKIANERDIAEVLVSYEQQKHPVDSKHCASRLQVQNCSYLSESGCSHCEDGSVP